MKTPRNRPTFGPRTPPSQAPTIPGDNRILFCKRDREQFGFLSNFYPSTIAIEDETWPTTEHFYQGQKSRLSEYRHVVRAAVSPGQAKRLGADPALPQSQSGQSWFRASGTDIRADWQQVKLEVMRIAVRAKFTQNADLARLLLATASAELIEDSEHDQFWGRTKNGDGLNWLGRVLMEVRATLEVPQAPVNQRSCGDISQVPVLPKNEAGR